MSTGYVLLGTEEYFIGMFTDKEVVRAQVIKLLESDISLTKDEITAFNEIPPETEDEAEYYESLISDIDTYEGAIEFFKKCSFDYTEIAGGYVVRKEPIRSEVF